MPVCYADQIAAVLALLSDVTLSFDIVVEEATLLISLWYGLVCKATGIALFFSRRASSLRICLLHFYIVVIIVLAKSDVSF